MFTIVFQTHEFPTDPEGDLVYNNGQPGSAAARWLRSTLSEHDVSTGDPIQEDYGWGLWLDDPTAIWIAVSYAGDDPDSPAAGLPLWYVSVVHETPIFAPRQWFRRKQGRELVSRVFQIIHDAISADPDIAIIEVERN